MANEVCVGNSGHRSPLSSLRVFRGLTEEGRRRKVDMSGYDITLIGYADELNVVEKGKRHKG